MVIVLVIPLYTGGVEMERGGSGGEVDGEGGRWRERVGNGRRVGRGGAVGRRGRRERKRDSGETHRLTRLRLTCRMC